MTYKVVKFRKLGGAVELILDGGVLTDLTISSAFNPELADVLYEVLTELHSRARFFDPPPGWRPPAPQTRWQRIKAVFRP